MRRKVLAVAVLAAALVAPVDASASAASWPSLPCPSGALMAGQSEADPVAGVVSVPGVISCGVPERGPQFAIAIFEIDGTGFGFVHSNLLKYYASPAGPTRFKVEGARMDDKIFAAASVCLMTDEKTRLSCVHVTSDLVVTQISTEDPSVARPVKFLPPGSETSPSCGGCWRVT
jgi:hypothetical protein